MQILPFFLLKSDFMDISKSLSGIEKKFFELTSTVVKESGLELYDMDYLPTQKLLRVYIFSKETGSAVIEDCVKVDHAFTDHLETLEWVPDEITLEVSSPGMYRQLSSLEHFKAAQGEFIVLHLKRPLHEFTQEELPRRLSKERKVRGVLDVVEEDKVTVNIDKYKIQISYEDLKKANLDPEFT